MCEYVTVWLYRNILIEHNFEIDYNIFKELFIKFHQINFYF